MFGSASQPHVRLLVALAAVLILEARGAAVTGALGDAGAILKERAAGAACD